MNTTTVYLGLSENRVYSQWNSHLIGIMIINHYGYTIFRHTHLTSRVTDVAWTNGPPVWVLDRSIQKWVVSVSVILKVWFFRCNIRTAKRQRYGLIPPNWMVWYQKCLIFCGMDWSIKFDLCRRKCLSTSISFYLEGLVSSFSFLWNGIFVDDFHQYWDDENWWKQSTSHTYIYIYIYICIYIYYHDSTSFHVQMWFVVIDDDRITLIRETSELVTHRVGLEPWRIGFRRILTLRVTNNHHYPLVMTNIAIENGHWYWVFPLIAWWWFSIVMLVRLPEGNHHNNHY